MGSRLPSWILLLYLAIDLANPFVPGAFRFTPEEGLVWVEGTSRCREGAGIGTSEVKGSAPLPPPAAPDERFVVPAAPARAGYLTAWLARIRTGDPAASDYPPESDDHH
jgi:hypothetical protein